MKVSVVATSSVIPQVELGLGLKKLSELGFNAESAANLASQDFVYAGTRAQRSEAFFKAACSDSDVVWAVRGGYGASQLLPVLESMSNHLCASPDNAQVPADKILVGYSDVTALYQFVSDHWQWRILHAPMLASKDFRDMTAQDQQSLVSLITSHSCDSRPWQKEPLEWINQGSLQSSPLKAMLHGGNLSVICALIGTPWQLDFAGKIVFIEEVAESWSKIDRMLTQLLQAGCLDNCQAIVLGKFSHCRDSSPKGLAAADSEQLLAIRAALDERQALLEVFNQLAKQLDIPIAYGLSVGHFDENAALPLMANYQLSIDAGLELLSWP